MKSENTSIVERNLSMKKMFRIAKKEEIENDESYQVFKKRQKKELKKLSELNENATRGLKKDLENNLITEIFENEDLNDS